MYHMLEYTKKGVILMAVSTLSTKNCKRRVSPRVDGQRGERKDVTVNIRMTSTEKAYLQSLAVSYGVTVSKLILDTVLGNTSRNPIR